MADGTAAPEGHPRILAVITGASSWPSYPGCEGGPTFSASAEAVMAYLRDPAGLALPPADTKWLFDSFDEAPQIIEQMERFISGRRRQLAEAGTPVTDLLLYHIGHGDLTRRGDAFFLPVRSTREKDPLGSSISAASLATLVDEACHGLRTTLVLDCCYAAAAHGAFMSGHPAVVAARKLADELPEHVDWEADRSGRLPEHGTALLCASGARDVARALPGAPHTMFTGALLDVLRQGDPRAPALVSLDDLQRLVRERLDRLHADGAVRPEVHVPRQRAGRVDRVPLFPNPARRATAAPVGPPERRAEGRDSDDARDEGDGTGAPDRAMSDEAASAAKKGRAPSGSRTRAGRWILVVAIGSVLGLPLVDAALRVAGFIGLPIPSFAQIPLALDPTWDAPVENIP